VPSLDRVSLDPAESQYEATASYLVATGASPFSYALGTPGTFALFTLATRVFGPYSMFEIRLLVQLMALGLAYDSDEGRAWAASITALMTGEAYATSARTAMRMGPFAGYTENREPMNRVLGMHRDALDAVDKSLAPAPVR